MIERIKRFFCDKIQATTQTDSQHALHLACAALMFEVARVDQSIDEAELSTISKHLERALNLPHDEVDTLMQLAHEESRDSTSVYQFTSLINESFDAGQKYEIIQNLWHVALADDSIDKYEEHIIRKIADLIYVPHVQFIEAKHLAQQARKD